VLLLLH